MIFKERMAHAIEPLQETARFLARLIHEAFSDLTYTTPRESKSGDAWGLPESIFESKTAENVCNVTLRLDITTVVSNLKELSNVSNAEDFYLKFNEFDYTVFTDEMVKFVEQFEKCTSYYSMFIDSLVALLSYFDSIASMDISFGDTFIFDKEAQVTW